MKRTLFLLTLTLTITAQAQTAVEAWSRRYNLLIDSRDYAHVVKVDGAGNVIVAGGTYDGFTGLDVLLIKYSNNGVPLWTNRYDGPAHSLDELVALTVDAGNNVIVAANSITSGNSQEILTIKYSSTGSPLWTNRYHGPGNGNDYVADVAVDSSGNVHVTGGSFGLGTSDDYVTLKYSSAGAPLWTNLYNGPGNGSDYSIGGLAIDTSGNVFVTGSSDSGTSYDLTTVAYSSTGAPLWVNRYRGLGDFDEPTALAVAGTTVFVTGGSYNANSSDFITLAYSTAGAPLWTNRYDGPGNSYDWAFAVAVAGTNVFVTGQSPGSGTQQDYATVAYSIAGVPLWTNRYNGPGNSTDSARALTVDASGNVFVTGDSLGSSTGPDFATVALSSAGTVLWIQRYNGPGNGNDLASSVATDTSGNVFITGTSASATSADWTTIKYSSTGVGSWTNRHNGAGKDSAGATAVVGDGSNNVVLTGYSRGNGSGYDYATIKYSGTGVPLWTNRYNGSDNLEDYPEAVAVDTNGNVYVTGFSVGLSSQSDFATIKYSSGGVPLWTNRYNGPAGNGDDDPRAVAVDVGGNVIVTGTSQSGTSSDYVTIKYSSAGVPLWTNRYDGQDNVHDIARALAVDSNGNVIVTGYSSSGSSLDYATIKYSSSGAAVWTNFYGGTDEFDEPHAVAVDSSGNVYVTGLSYQGTSSDYATIKYSSAGVPLWTNRYDGPGNGEDDAQAVAVDNSGNVYVTGFSYSGTSYDYATIKYSSAGVPLWTNRFDGPASDDDQAKAVVVDGNGTVFVTGYSAGLDSNWDFATIAYSSSGSGLWTNRYNGPLNGYDEPYGSRSMAVAGIGSVVVVGTSAFGQHSDFATVKYVTVPALNIRRTATNTVAVSWPSPSTDFRLQQNTNGITTVNWSNVTAAPIDNGTNKTLIVNPPSGNRYYRLIYP